MVKKSNYEPIKSPFKLIHTLLKIARRAIMRLPTVTLIMRLLRAVLRL